MTPADAQFSRYQDLQRYVGWTDDDARNVRSVAALLDPHLAGLVDDFYAEIEQHPAARKVITGGAEQIARLKGTLLDWLRQLLGGPYDREYVARRWRVGWRHVEIGLDQVYTNVALSRLRRGLLRVVTEAWPGDLRDLLPVRQSLNTLLDLDLAIIEDAYQAEYHARHQRTERMAAIGQVGGGIAHELRNPLNVIKTSVYYLLNAKHPTPAKTAEHLGRIERQVVLADGVITALSNFARMPTPDLKPIPIRRVVEEAVESNPPPAGVVVTHDWPADLPDVLADADQLRIVFANLVRNAREAMGGTGTLTLAGRAAGGGAVVTTVTDTGGGIAPENLGRVMEPLFTTKARGIGLGLALSRAILEKNKGSLRVASTPGQGTTFTVRLTTAEGDRV
ncbi:sensor histidine kinase [Urbifossiella limnaea]|uniref:histidine kinase n=1 Tax=Urbifossiella limnaea TaxID=2528023 RepID=A0A517Y280_9BACT|nr:protoglobin domain-containing protein [Urbifossiella limnaea]QDU23862.1 Globin-coupled histidine kinase [Urbifossiella limnaea]